ncbi:MAG: hypothetical protein R2747_20215 [Pyrinomonadaceae bacterium]
MDAKEKIQTLNSLIANEEGFIKWSVIRAAIPFVIGVTTSILLYFFGPESHEIAGFWNATIKSLNTIPGLFGTTFAAFSVKDYFDRKNRITSFNFLKIQYVRFEKETKKTGLPDNLKSDLEKIDQRFWILVDKYLA